MLIIVLVSLLLVYLVLCLYSSYLRREKKENLVPERGGFFVFSLFLFPLVWTLSSSN